MHRETFENTYLKLVEKYIPSSAEFINHAISPNMLRGIHMRTIPMVHENSMMSYPMFVCLLPV